LNEEPSLSEMPRLYDVFEQVKMKSVRAVTKLKLPVDLKEMAVRLPRIKRVRTSNKNVIKFQLRRGCYLLLFPTGYVEVHAPDEGGVREVLVAFRDEMYKSGLL